MRPRPPGTSVITRATVAWSITLETRLGLPADRLQSVERKLPAKRRRLRKKFVTPRREVSEPAGDTSRSSAGSLARRSARLRCYASTTSSRTASETNRGCPRCRLQGRGARSGELGGANSMHSPTSDRSARPGTDVELPLPGDLGEHRGHRRAESDGVPHRGNSSMCIHRTARETEGAARTARRLRALHRGPTPPAVSPRPGAGTRRSRETA